MALSRRCSRSWIRVDPAPPGRRRRGERYGRGDAAAGARAPSATRRRAVFLRSRRVVPEPRAESAAPREPEVHRRENARRGRRPGRRVRRRRRPLLLRRRHRRVRPGRLRDGAPGPRDARQGAGCDGDLRGACARALRQSRGRSRRQGASPLVNRVGHAFIKERMREVDALFARRGLGALLLPRVHSGRHRRRAVPRHARAPWSRGGQTLSELLEPVPRAVLPRAGR